jgi:hypothetical protein
VILPASQIAMVRKGRTARCLIPAGSAYPKPPVAVNTRVGLRDSVRVPVRAEAHVVGARDVLLGSLGDDDARDLGFRDLDGLMLGWTAAYGPWNENARGWVVELRDQSEEPRMLHRVVRLGYTANPAMAAPGEPEALQPDELAALTQSAGRRETARSDRLLVKRRNESLEDRLRLVLAEARQRGVMLGSDLRVVANAVGRMEHRVHRPVDRSTSAERSEAA